MTDFLEALWGSLDSDHAGYLWTDGTKRSHWYTWPAELSQASLQAEKLADSGQNVYFGVGLGPGKLSSQQRTQSEKVTAIAGIWADIDYRSEQHKKKNLPPNIEEAIKLAIDMPQPPSAILSTGHGIAAWWLFKEPWVFESAEERQEAAWVVENWQRALRARAAEQGWDVDSTHDLARIMRLPGTKNYKDPQAVKDVVLLEDYMAERRYARTDLELFMINTDPTLRTQVEPAELPAGWKPGPIQSTDHFRVQMEENEDFREAWEHRRKFQDQSLSSYDLSIASIAANAGWDDVQIADLIAEHRRIHGDTSKGTRPDYLARTIAVARRKSEVEQSIERILDGDATALTSGNPLEKARATWSALGIHDVVSWYKVLGDQIEFVLVLPGGEVRMNEETFGTYTAIQRRMVTNLGVSLVGVKGQPAWWRMAAGLTNLAEERGDAPDPVAIVWGWLNDYIAENGLEASDMEHRRERLNRDGALRIDDPRSGTLVVVRGAALLRFIQMNDAEDKLSKGELARLWVRAGGKVNVPITVGPRDSRTTVKAWTIPLVNEE